MVIDDKGEEVIHKDRCLMKEGDQLKFEAHKHTSRGSKLINLYVAFIYALHMFACMAQVFKFHIHACVVYARFVEND